MTTRPPIPAISPDWREGRWFDRWMLVHVASGIAGGFFGPLVGLGAAATLLIGGAVMVVWELAEFRLGVRETLSNRVLDVVLGGLGLAAALVVARGLGPRGLLVAWLAGAAVAVGGSVMGWLAYRRRRAAR